MFISHTGGVARHRLLKYGSPIQETNALPLYPFVPWKKIWQIYHREIILAEVLHTQSKINCFVEIRFCLMAAKWDKVKTQPSFIQCFTGYKSRPHNLWHNPHSKVLSLIIIPIWLQQSEDRKPILLTPSPTQGYELWRAVIFSQTLPHIYGLFHGKERFCPTQTRSSSWAVELCQNWEIAGNDIFCCFCSREPRLINTGTNLQWWNTKGADLCYGWSRTSAELKRDSRQE